jgi:dTDP-4-dehydrorhamnose reductase/beta-phosphoglucomutase-like phosphatase (HAD superfamily)
MKIFVAGASGILGRDLCKILSKNNLDWIGSYNSRPTINCVKLDFFNEQEVEKNLLENNIDVIINCIVERFTDVCEKDWERTIRTNVDIPDILSKVCAKNGIYLIHISTDYVFDGRKPPYSSSSEPNPLQNYGISKLIAEYRVKANGGNYLIVRVPVLYTNSYEYLDETAVTTIGKKVMNQIEVFTEDNVSIRRPVFIPDFCNFLIYCLEKKEKGITHFYNHVDKITKYSMINRIADYLNLPLNTSPIDSFGSGSANRPIDTELIGQQTTFFKTTITSGIIQCFERYSHPRFSECPQDFLVLFDLDGTLIDSETLHYDAYKTILSPYIDLQKDYFFNIINTGSINKMFEELNIPEDEWDTLRKKKQEIMKNDVNWIDGAENFINYLESLGIEMVIVTNTNRSIIEGFSQKLSVLRKAKWICKEDYKTSKPNPECYKMAIELYGPKKYIVGFENTINGLRALKGVTHKTYCITQKGSSFYPLLKKEDTILIKNFDIFLDTRK